MWENFKTMFHTYEYQVKLNNGERYVQEVSPKLAVEQAKATEYLKSRGKSMLYQGFTPTPPGSPLFFQ